MGTETNDKNPRDLEAFGVAVRIERKAQGFSQEKFADFVGLDRSYMGGIERGERNIALMNVMRIVRALGMKPSAFFQHLDRVVAPDSDEGDVRP